MTARLIIVMAVWPLAALGQWIQVGFLESGQIEGPDRVTIEQEDGSWQRELEIRNRYDIRQECIVSEPLVLPRHKSDGTFAVRWEQDGLVFRYQFKPLLGQPLQILLDQPKIDENSDKNPALSEPVITLAPNPFNPTTTLSMTLPLATRLKLEVFDIQGRQVTLLADGDYTAGTHQWTVDGSNWATGTYFLSYRLSPGQSGVRRMVLVK